MSMHTKGREWLIQHLARQTSNSLLSYLVVVHPLRCSHIIANMYIKAVQQWDGESWVSRCVCVKGIAKPSASTCSVDSDHMAEGIPAKLCQIFTEGQQMRQRNGSCDRWLYVFMIVTITPDMTMMHAATRRCCSSKRQNVYMWYLKAFPPYINN